MLSPQQDFTHRKRWHQILCVFLGFVVSRLIPVYVHCGFMSQVIEKRTESYKKPSIKITRILDKLLVLKCIVSLFFCLLPQQTVHCTEVPICLSALSPSFFQTVYTFKIKVFTLISNHASVTALSLSSS